MGAPASRGTREAAHRTPSSRLSAAERFSPPCAPSGTTAITVFSQFITPTQPHPPEHSAIYAFFGRPNAVLITSLGVLSQYSRYCTISPLAGSRVSTQRPVTVTTCAARPRTRLGTPHAQGQPWAGAATGRRLSTGRRGRLEGDVEAEVLVEEEDDLLLVRLDVAHQPHLALVLDKLPREERAGSSLMESVPGEQVGRQCRSAHGARTGDAPKPRFP